MAEKEPMIVIKKITIEEAGAHGGAWKVAFADFMTALMSFFLVMWLLASANPEQKKAVADYFSTPSVIEYQFSAFGTELSLEKLFLDLISEPLKFFQGFVQPADRTPNIMDMGLKKVTMAYMADNMGEMAENVTVNSDSVYFEIPDYHLFLPGTAEPVGNFSDVIARITTITKGLEYATVTVDSILFHQSVADGSPATAEKVATQRVDGILKAIQLVLEHETVQVTGRIIVERAKQVPLDGTPPAGRFKFAIVQRTDLPDAPKKKLSDGLFGKGDPDKSVYDNFVKKLTTKKQNEAKSK
jgi:chemotaxis protein MotB